MPRTARRGVQRGICAAGILFALAGTAAAQEWTQTFELVPGWNAIYLHVQPSTRDPGVLFSGIPVRSVWTRGVEPSSVQFIRDPSDALMGQRGWLAFVPDERDEAMAPALADRELVNITGNRAFLIDLGGSQNVTLRITGQALVPVINWQPNQYTLAGFPIDPDAAPTFSAYFDPSPAHRGQPVYRLLPSGRWERVGAPNADRMRYGEAYWVYSTAGSRYLGPLAVTLPTSDGLSYGRGVTDHILPITNLSGSAVTVTIEDQKKPDSVPLSYFTIATSGPNVGRFQWPDLTGPLSLPAAARGSQTARLAVRRGAFNKPQVATVIAVRNGTGMRLLVPLTAQGDAATAAVSGPGTSSRYAGLWVGGIEVNKVSQPQLGLDKPVSTQGSGNACAGGPNESGTCSAATQVNDCPGFCTLRCAGGTRKDLACTVATQAADCPGSTCVAPPRSCAGGANSGLPCKADADCPAGVDGMGRPVTSSCTAAPGNRCAGGSNDGGSCTKATDCSFSCVESTGGSVFSMRLLLHVNGSGQVRLLKQVIQMWRDGTTKPDPLDPTKITDDQPGHYVLLTDDTLLSRRDSMGNLLYKGASLRDGVRAGRRVSTAHFDFPGNDLQMTGTFGAPNTVTATITLAPDFPTNPFRHKFHPDHDNLRAEGAPDEVFEITRDMSLAFSATDPTALGDPDFGYDTVGGTYRETIRGLHHNPIYVEGAFRLQRADTTAELNQ